MKQHIAGAVFGRLRRGFMKELRAVASVECISPTRLPN